MRRFTKRLALCSILAATLLTMTVSAQKLNFDIVNIPNKGSLSSDKYNPKDDSEGQAYVRTTSATVVQNATIMTAWVVDAGGTAVSTRETLPYSGLVNPIYYSGKNLAGSRYKLRVSYSCIPAKAPGQGEAHGYWYS